MMRLLVATSLVATVLLLVTSTVLVHAQDERREEGDRGFYNSQASSSALVTQIRSLPVARLRRFLSDRDADCDGCFEKQHLIDRAVAVRSWPTFEDAIAADLSLGHDLQGPLPLAVPAFDDRSVLFDPVNPDETIAESPAARPELNKLSDGEVAALLQLYQMRVLQMEGLARCGLRFLNGTQFCVPSQPILTTESSTM